MQMEFSEVQQMTREAAARFARESLAENAARLDCDEGGEQYIANLRALAQLGFMGIGIKSEYGGADAGAVSYALAILEIAKVCASTATAVSVSNMVAEVVQAVGAEEQKQKYIPPLLSGEWPAASFCLTESGAGSDPAAMRFSARRDGNNWILSGAKQWISSASIAGFFLVWAVTDSDAPKGKGISCFLVPRESAGLSVGDCVDKMGQRGSPTNEVVFNEVRVPRSEMLGELNGGFRIAMSELYGGRIGVAALALGVAYAAMESARRYMTEREQHGKKLAQHQGLQWILADRFTELEAGFWLLMRAASLKDSAKPYAKEASMAKLFCSEFGERACRDALQLFGGYGYMRELPLERFYRDIRIASIYEGTSQIQKLIIARELLREIN